MLKNRNSGRRDRNRPLDREEAEAIAIAAFSHIAEDFDRVERFAALSGLDAGRMREASRQPGFLLAVLDHLAGHEPDLLAFADAAGLDPARVAAARDALATNRTRRHPNSED